MPKVVRTGTRSTQTRFIQDNTRDKHTSYLSFSLKYFKQEPSEFDIQKKDTQYFLKVLERLKNISEYPQQELYSNQSKALRFHSIDWKDTSQTCFGIVGEEQLVDKPYQFSVSKSKHGRVIGFIIDNVFYVVWFDHGHEVYR